MADEAPVVNEPVAAEPTPAESTPVESNSSEAADDAFDKGFDDGETPSKPAEAEDTIDLEEADETPTEETPEAKPDDEEKPRSKADERRDQLNSEIRDLVAQRNAIRADVERYNGQVYQPATEADLLQQINPETGEYFTPIEARVTVMQQQAEVKDFNERVSESRLTLVNEAQKALRDFPMFDQENSDSYNKEIAPRVDQLLAQTLEYDPNTNQVIGSKVSPYHIYQLVNDAFHAGTQTGQIKGQKATEKMLANSEPSSNAPISKPKEDQFLKGFDDNF